MASRSILRRCLQLTSSSTLSSAHAFLQLGQRNRSLTTPPLAPFLEFLAPSITAPASYHGWASKNVQRRQIKRSFTSSSTRQTSAIVNPREDDEGQPMSVEITPRASKRLKDIMTKDANPNLALRIQVESGGCHGFQYLMSLITLPPLSLKSPSSDQIDEEDTVFSADDGTGAMVVMDGPSLELLKGSKIDYTMELIGSQFKIVDNPLATSSCGCGTSFDIKV